MLRESSLSHRHSHEVSRASFFGNCLRSCAVWVITLTVSLAPWLLGGAIPHAKCVLLVGALVGSGLALSGCVFRKEAPVAMPLTALPLLGLCLIGLLQLMPVYEHPALQMKHAVNHSLAMDLPVFQDPGAVQKSYPLTVLPAETRQGIAQLLAMVLIVLVVNDCATTPRDVAVVMVGLVLSGCGMTALAISQQYGVLEVVVGNHWKVSRSTPFGCFVNPNNAASWLIVCLAAAVYLCGRCFKSRDPGRIQPSRSWETLGDKVWLQWGRFLGRLAEMDSSQILASAAIILLTAGIAATLSRAGIVAATLGIAAFYMSRFLAGRWIASLVSLMLFLVLSSFFMNLMELDTNVISELRTLEDPVLESTGRLLHWTDSLQSCMDFPLFGSGLSAYRCASMPYQRHDTGKWFQRADNQYVEMLVECGFAGLCCYLAVGLLMMSFVFRVLVVRHGRTLVNIEVAELLGSASFLSVAGLAGAAFFDYGTSLASVASAFVTIMAILERWSVSKPKRDPAPGGNSGPNLLSGYTSVCVWFFVIVACLSQLPDALAAARIYDVTAPSERLIATSDFEGLTDSGDRLDQELKQSLLARPDDLLGQRVRVLLLELLCRRDLLLGMLEGNEEPPERISAMFRQLDFASINFHLMDKSVPAQLKQAVQQEVEVALKKYEWQELSKALLRRSVGLPSVGLTQVESDLLFDDQASRSSGLAYLRFSEPNGTAALFEVGQILLRKGRLNEARECWSQSLVISEAFRPRMMIEVAMISGTEAALDWLMPPDYESCVNCILECKAHEQLLEKLIDRANQLWVEQAPERTESVILLRAEHLMIMGDETQAIGVLDGYLHLTPRNLPVRKAKARVLERLGRNGDAYDEWLRIGSFYPNDPEVESALKRLVKLPPTSYQ